MDKLKKSAEFVAKPMSAGLWGVSNAATVLFDGPVDCHREPGNNADHLRAHDVLLVRIDESPNTSLYHCTIVN